MSGVVPVNPKQGFLSATGAPLVGGFVDTYLAGTTTRADTWQDRDLTTANTNPIELDARGECDLFVNPTLTYKFVVKDSNGVEQYTVNNVPGATPSASFTADLAAAVADAVAAGTTGAEAAQAAAETAQAAAEAAAAAAQASGKVFANTTAGLAGTTNGQYFLIVSASSTAIFDLYLNNAGTAVSQNKSIPSTGLLNSDSTITNAVSVWQDSAGERSMEADSSGALAVRDVLFGNARSLGELATTVDTKSTMLDTLRNQLARSIDKAFGNAQTSFSAGSATLMDIAVDGQASWRLPVLCRISATQYLLFVNSQSGSGDFTQMSVYYRLLTVNATTGAITKGTLTQLTGAQGGADDGTGKAFQYQLGSVVRTKTGRIIVNCTYRNTDALVHVPYCFTSDDAAAAAIAGSAATWTKTNITTSFPALGVTWNALIFGPGKGIQIKRGSPVDRIVMPYWRSDNSYPASSTGLYAGYAYSDDNGATWAPGAESWLSRSNESSVAEDYNGNVLLFVRREGKAGKWVHLSDDGGSHIFSSWQLDQTTVNAPVVECGITQTCNDFDQSTPKIIYTSPRPTTAASNTTGLGRDHPTIRASYDGGITFPYSYQVGTGACAYSAVEAFGEAGLLFVWESSNATIAGQVISINQVLTGA